MLSAVRRVGYVTVALTLTARGTTPWLGRDVQPICTSIAVSVVALRAPRVGLPCSTLAAPIATRLLVTERGQPLAVGLLRFVSDAAAILVACAYENGRVGGALKPTRGGPFDRAGGYARGCLVTAHGVSVSIPVTGMVGVAGRDSGSRGPMRLCDRRAASGYGLRGMARPLRPPASVSIS